MGIEVVNSPARPAPASLLKTYSTHPTQKILLNTEEQQLYNEHLSNDWHPHPIVKGEPRQPLEEAHFCLYPWSFSVTTHTLLPWVNGGTYTLGSLFASIDQYTSTVLCQSIYSPPLINKTQRCLNSFTRGRSEQSLHPFPADNDVSVVPILIPVTSHSPANHPI